MMGSKRRNFNILTFGSQVSWKMHFQRTFWLQRTSYSWLINTIFPREYYGLMISLFVVHTIFFFVTRHDRVVLLFMYEQKLFNFNNIQLEQRIHFLHNPFFIHPATQMLLLSLNNKVKQKSPISKQHLQLFDT